MKKSLLLLIAIAVAGIAKSQTYGEYDLGYVVNPLNSNAAMMSLHFGYQLNNVADPNVIAIAEYDQRALTGGVSPVYFGGRLGLGYITGEYTSFALLGGKYFRLISGDDKTKNYWINGGGVQFLYKSLVLEVSKVEYFQVSVGCHYSFE